MSDKNIYWQPMEITRVEREKQFGSRSFLMWFTGLSGSGKSALAGGLQTWLFRQGYPVYLLDGDNIRHGLSSDLGFTFEDRRENIRRVGEVAKLFVDAGIIVLASFISPYERNRAIARSLFAGDDFVEVYVKASVETCEKRDTKGLYKKARQGLINNFTGISAPYEEPKQPELILDTDNHDFASCISQLQQFCTKRYNLGEAFQIGTMN